MPHKDREQARRNKHRYYEEVLRPQRGAVPREERKPNRHYNLRKYGIGAKEYDALLKSQGGVCAICGRHPDGGEFARSFHVDHDHAKQKGDPGFIRGILCHGCNAGLGNLQDRLAVLEAAVRYLKARVS